MSEEQTARILPFAPLSEDATNLQIDLEIQEQARADAMAAMADDALIDLEVERIIKGEVSR